MFDIMSLKCYFVMPFYMMSIGAWNSYVSSGSVIPLKEGGIKHRLTKYLRRFEGWVLVCTPAKIIPIFFLKIIKTSRTLCVRQAFMW